MIADDDTLRAKILLDTARINWLDLQRYFARGATIKVDPSLNLIDVGFELYRDNKATFEGWMAEGLVGAIEPEQAQQWFDTQKELWAVVIAPWVLVQDKTKLDS
ncbi:MAG: DUF2288 domain-containing protein [Hahellaceae bacterium]|nr:DUF2288 domain-containing protein [Hahellaceae bacterium]MCP5169005.1 DUF2288 domain-containing protein [Hahellaceae bacterium]